MYVSEPNKFHVELEDDDGILTNTTQPDESVSSLTCVNLFVLRLWLAHSLAAVHISDLYGYLTQ